MHLFNMKDMQIYMLLCHYYFKIKISIAKKILFLFFLFFLFI